MNMKPYYSAQLGWEQYDYGCLNRFLAKLLRQRERRGDEISAIDLRRTTSETRALMKCIIESTKPNEIYAAFPNLVPLQDEPPLETPLVLTDNPLCIYPAYEAMNVII